MPPEHGATLLPRTFSSSDYVATWMARPSSPSRPTRTPGSPRRSPHPDFQLARPVVSAQTPPLLEMLPAGPATPRGLLHAQAAQPSAFLVPVVAVRGAKPQPSSSRYGRLAAAQPVPLAMPAALPVVASVAVSAPSAGPASVTCVAATTAAACHTGQPRRDGAGPSAAVVPDGGVIPGQQAWAEPRQPANGLNQFVGPLGAASMSSARRTALAASKQGAGASGARRLWRGGGAHTPCAPPQSSPSGVAEEPLTTECIKMQQKLGKLSNKMTIAL